MPSIDANQFFRLATAGACVVVTPGETVFARSLDMIFGSIYIIPQARIVLGQKNRHEVAVPVVHHQYSDGRSMVVELRSASVITHSLVPSASV